MTTRPPAEIGMSLDEVDTPALVIDLDAFERNLRRLADRVAGSAVRLRPHAKTHKCPVIALKQIELGAVGVCVQKVSEAEAMVYGGVRDVLVTNEIVGRQKLRRLMALAHTARIGVCVDDAAQVAALEAAAGEAGVTLPVHVEINMGGNRCGVEPGEPALDLARLIADAPHLALPGCRPITARPSICAAGPSAQQAIAGAVEKAALTRDLLAATGSPAPTSPAPAPAPSSSRRKAASTPNCSAAPTSSWTPITAAISTATARRPAPSSRALFVWATVMSRPAGERAIVDAGLKALAFDSGPPTVWDEPAATYERASDEHGRLGIAAATNRLRLGDKVRLVPGHCDPTVNLYDWYVAVRGERVEAIWPITARGAVY